MSFHGNTLEVVLKVESCSFKLVKKKKKGEQGGKNPFSTVSCSPEKEKRTPGGILGRKGKAKLKNIQQEGE